MRNFCLNKKVDSVCGTIPEVSSDLYTYMSTHIHTQVGTKERGGEEERKKIYIYRIGSIIAKFPSSYRMILWLFWSTLGTVALRLTVKAESRDWRSTSENRSKVRR